MVTATALRLGGWVIGATVGGAAFGMGWATQEIAIPLWALLVLTFLPTLELMVFLGQFLPGDKTIQVVGSGDNGGGGE